MKRVSDFLRYRAASVRPRVAFAAGIAVLNVVLVLRTIDAHAGDVITSIW